MLTNITSANPCLGVTMVRNLRSVGVVIEVVQKINKTNICQVGEWQKSPLLWFDGTNNGSDATGSIDRGSKRDKNVN